LEIEADHAGAVDDVVQRHADHPHTYTQVKYTSRTGSVLDTDYLLTRRRGGRSLLEKLLASWRLLRTDRAAPSLELVTNRVLSPTDGLLSLCDGRTDLLMPAAATATPRSLAGRTLAGWAAHLNTSPAELLTMLEHLRFHTGRGVSAERERAAALMLAAGLRADGPALRLGTATVADWVLQGRRVLTPEEITEQIDTLGLRVAEARATLLIQAIARDVHPDDATVALDWVDLFDGDEPALRRSTKDPAAWNRMSSELDIAINQLRDDGHREVMLRGAMRLATFFTVGARLARVTGVTVHYARDGAVWSSSARRTEPAALQVNRVRLDQGADLAVAFGITLDPTGAVARYLRSAGIPVRELLTLLPGRGPHDQSVASPGHAVSLAQQLRDRVRAELEHHAAARVHLFQAGPAGLSFLTGHRWNRVAPTLLYEDLGAGAGYTPTFAVGA
jgi:hypothetical protein